MWQAEADTELTLSASPTTAVGQKALALAKRRYSMVSFLVKSSFPQNAQKKPAMQSHRVLSVNC